MWYNNDPCWKHPVALSCHLSNLICNISIDGSTNLSNSANQISRFKAAGWHTQAIDGHNHNEIEKALINAKKSRRPSLIACKTTIGYGAPSLAGTSKTHGAPLGVDEIIATRKALAWASVQVYYFLCKRFPMKVSSLIELCTCYCIILTGTN